MADKALICSHESGAVHFVFLAPEIVGYLTRGGYFNLAELTADQRAAGLEREVAKMLLPDRDGSAPAHMTEDLARRWVQALAYGGLTEEEAHALIVEKDAPGVLEHAAVAESVADELAQDNFRDAMRFDRTGAGCVRHDMDHCREIHKNTIREQRARLMRNADADFFKQLEAWLAAQPGLPAGLQAVMAQKQALRDATADPAIAAAATPEELRTVVPQAMAAAAPANAAAETPATR